MKKFFKILLMVLFLILFVGTFIFLYEKSKPGKTQYQVLVVTTRDLSNNAVLTGDVEPRNKVMIKPQISGIISKLYKQPGEMVKDGEIIAQVKVIPDMSTLNATQSRVRLAKINLAQVKLDYDREKKLYDDRLVSGEEYQKSLQAYQQCKEELSAAKDAYEIARTGVAASQKDLSTTLVKSTINGLILDIPVKVGTSVIMSNNFNDGTTIATVANMKDLIFKGTIDETQVALLKVGMPMKISIGALPNQSFSATLEYIAPQVKNSMSTANQFEIKGALTVPKGVTIRAGYSANAEIALQNVQNAVAVPEAGIVYEDGKPYAYVQVKENPQKFQRRAVKIGLSNGMYIQVLSGLKAGDKVRGNIIDNLPSASAGANKPNNN